MCIEQAHLKPQTSTIQPSQGGGRCTRGLHGDALAVWALEGPPCALAHLWSQQDARQGSKGLTPPACTVVPGLRPQVTTVSRSPNNADQKQL